MERGFAMRPRERRETSEQELFRSRLDQIIDMKHALVKLARGKHPVSTTEGPRRSSAGLAAAFLELLA